MGSKSAATAGPRQHLLSFRDFVEQALFHPRWGYYATGAVRFGDGGHFDTYPLALSPYFGMMVARRAHSLWRAAQRPRRFEVCEIGAGNGQLCLDVLAHVAAQAACDPGWRSFAKGLRYRIIEKSPALRRRQAELLGPLAGSVTWTNLDLSQARRVATRRGVALIVANEVLDCLAHEKVVLGRDRVFRAVHVAARRRGGGPLLTRGEIAAALAAGERLRFRELLLPVQSVRGLRRFLWRHYSPAEVRSSRLPWTYFACPSMPTFVANLAGLYHDAEILLIDYGGDRGYHLLTPGARRISAGRPEERNATPYRAPGRDDITFLVDFSVALRAAAAAALKISYYGPQGGLARLSRVRLDDAAIKTIIEHRALGWLLAVTGVGPEQRQRSASLSWSKPPGRHRKTLAREAREAVDGFVGHSKNRFQLLVLRKRPTRSAAGVGRARGRAFPAGSKTFR